MLHCSPPVAHWTLSRFTKPHSIYRFFSRFITHFIFKYLCTIFYTFSLFKFKNMQEFKIIYICYFLFSLRYYFSNFFFFDLFTLFFFLIYYLFIFLILYCIINLHFFFIT